LKTILSTVKDDGIFVTGVFVVIRDVAAGSKSHHAYNNHRLNFY